VKKIIFVITGGQIRDPAFLRSKLTELDPSKIICADSGARHLYPLRIIPDVIIGDMDSLSQEMQTYFEEKGSRFIKYPEAKDETDTQLALEYACDLAPEEIYVFGAFGSRIDHVTANIFLLLTAAKRDIAIILIDELCEAFVVSRECVISGERGQTVSLLPLSDKVTGITLSGFEYMLENGVMEIGKPYGISNRLTATKGVISLMTGHLLVIRYFKVEDLP
jgi:thiamine pyrophosphokinase